MTETWFKEGIGKRVMERMIDLEKYQWIGRERKNQKSCSGDGGIGFLINKRIGKVEEVRQSKNNEILWIKITGKTELYLAVIYMTPEGSSRENDSLQTLLELENDILEFSKLARVVVMGDFNARIGNLESTVLVRGERRTFSRKNLDNNFKGSQVREQGRKIVESMNACNMVILNGIEQEAEFTCISTSKGQSVIDYVVVQDKLMVRTGEKAPIKYKQNSMKVWTEEIMSTISDHRLITVEIELRKQLKTRKSNKIAKSLKERNRVVGIEEITENDSSGKV